MTIKTKFLVFFAMVVVIGLPWWISNYAQYSNNPFIEYFPVLTTAFCAMYLSAKTIHQKRKIVLYSVAAQQVAFILKVVKDCYEDPTNHSLLPFEMAIFIIITTLVCILAALMGSELRRPGVK